MASPHDPTPTPKTAAKRAIPAIPVIVALVAVVAAFVFAVSHLGSKGAAPQRNATPEQVATNTTPPERGPYNADDFSEPKAQ